MGENAIYDRSKVERIATTLSRPMINVLGAGRNNHNSATVFGNGQTVEALRKRGLIHGDNRWTALGRRVAEMVAAMYAFWGDDYRVYSIDALHAMALAEDRARSGLPVAYDGKGGAIVPPAVKPAPTPRTHAVGDRVTLFSVPRAVWRVLEILPATAGTVTVAKLCLIEDPARYMLPGPGHVIPAPVSALIPVPRPPVRPTIVDQIINGGPFLDENGPLELRIRPRDLRQLRDYLLHELAGKEFDSRVVRRAQYEALRAVRGRLDAAISARPAGSAFSPFAVRNMITDAAVGLRVPLTGLLEATDE